MSKQSNSSAPRPSAQPLATGLFTRLMSPAEQALQEHLNGKTKQVPNPKHEEITK